MATKKDEKVVKKTTVKKVKEESGMENIKVVATGGLGRIISESTDAIDIYDANLTLKGIYLVYKKQQDCRKR